MNTWVSMIAAVARNGVIGKDGKLPWHDTDDLKNFQERTAGKLLICGRRTYDSLPSHKLSTHDREVVVVSRSIRGQDFDAVRRIARASKRPAMVIGGGEIYQLFLPFTYAMHLSIFNNTPEGDTFFPLVQLAEWSQMHNGFRTGYTEISCFRHTTPQEL